MQCRTHVWVTSRLHPSLRPRAVRGRPAGWLAYFKCPALHSVRRSIVSQNPALLGQMVVLVVAVPSHCQLLSNAPNATASGPVNQAAAHSVGWSTEFCVTT